jgi:hypothetical protein
MTESNPHCINELQSDLRGVKEGWYATDKRGNLLLGPFSQSGVMPDPHQPSDELGSV